MRRWWRKVSRTRTYYCGECRQPVAELNRWQGWRLEGTLARHCIARHPERVTIKGGIIVSIPNVLVSCDKGGNAG